MDTASVSIKQSKYAEDLEELEKLKKKAKEAKPKPPTSYFFLNVLVTSLLLFVLFIIGFVISYNNAQRKLIQESAGFTPQAQLTLPKEQVSQCKPIYKTGDFADHSDSCTSAKTKEECLAVDLYNESMQDFSEPDKQPDCEWR